MAPAASVHPCPVRHTYLRLTAAKPGAGGSLTVTGYRTRAVCGGPDDGHYVVSGTTVTADVVTGASVTVWPLPGHLRRIRPDGLAAYLATDNDTRIFMVTGPFSAVTALAEQYHP